jgi:hypothetical protein
LEVDESREFLFYSKVQKRSVADLIIVEYPNGLHVLGLSNSLFQIPNWNANIPSFLHVKMAFALTYLHDDKAFFLFYLANSLVKREVAEFFKNYRLKIKDKWTIINYLYLANPMNPSKNVFSNFSL